MVTMTMTMTMTMYICYSAKTSNTILRRFTLSKLYMQIIYANYMQMSMYIEIRCIMAPNYHILVLTN